MPYTIVEEDGKYCVHKQNVDGSAGERVACHDTKQGAINQIGAIESNEKAESDFDTSEWDGSASNWSSTEAYCRDCLIDLNEGDEKVQSKCKLPFRKEGSTKWNINALKTMATGRGLSAVDAPESAKQSAARRIAAKWKLAFGTEVPESISRYLGNKSYVTFKQDKNGDWWFIGLYSNKFKDREEEIISEEAHREYTEWVRSKGIKPQITLFHMPRAQPGFWYSVMQAYDKGMIRTETINTMLRDFYKDYALAEAERVFYANGFVGVAGKVYKGREAWVNNLSNYPEELGMSHGFIPIELNGKIYTKYRSFEMSILPKSRAANIWTKVDFVEGTMPLDAKDQEFLDNIQQGTAEEVDTATEETRQQLEDKGVEFKENDAPELTVDAVIKKLVETMKWDEFGQALHQQLTEINSRFDQIENRLKEIERTEDEKVANLYQPNWQQFLPRKEGEEKKVEKQTEKHFDFLSALLTPKQN